MKALESNGFSDIARDFAEARQILIGNAPLTEATIAPVLDRLLDEDDSPKLQKIGVVYDRLIRRLPGVLDRRDQIGMGNGLFEQDA